MVILKNLRIFTSNLKVIYLCDRLLKTHNMEIVQISCNKCGHPMPKLRLTKYGYDFCVECSTVSTKRGVPVMKGSGDHTWTETVIMEEEQYKSYINPEGNPEITFGIENS